MLHKTFSRFNTRGLLYLNVSKIRNKKPLLLGSRTSVHCFSSWQKKEEKTKKTLYSTHQVTRDLKTGTVKLNTPKAKENRAGLNLSNRFCFKLMLAVFQDKGVKYHLGRSFLDGVDAAFFFVSDCLNNKNYDSLTDVVTPKLLQRIKNEEVCSQRADSKVFLAKNVIFVTMANFSWSLNRETKIKTLEVLVRFAYFDKKVQPPKSFQGWMTLFKTGKLEGSTLNFAHFKFFRTYGEEIKDSPWIIKDLYYYPGAERLFVSVR